MIADFRAALAALILAFAPTSVAAQQPDKPKVVATFTILADLARQIGGDRVMVETIVGANADAHSFAPKPADAKILAQARLVVVNGLGFDAWSKRLIEAAGYKGETLIASAGVTPRRAEDDHDHGHAEVDPHAWQDPANVKIYVANLRDALSRVDPAGRESYAARADAYGKQLDALKQEIGGALSAIPKERRRIVTTHEAFGYFGQAFDVAFIAAQGVSGEGDVSAKRLGALIRQIRAEKIPAVFLENLNDPRLAERLAKETGAKIGGALHADALTPAGGVAPTYLDMMRSNAKAIADALR